MKKKMIAEITITEENTLYEIICLAREGLRSNSVYDTCRPLANDIIRLSLQIYSFQDIANILDKYRISVAGEKMW